MSALQRVCRRSGVIWALGNAAAITLLSSAIYYELHRVQTGKLFLFALPGDAPATLSEIADAQQSARLLLIPAVVSPIALGAVFAIAAAQLRSRIRFCPLPWWLVILLLGTCWADCVTTVGFFHTAGIDHELHPGIRLFGYAYGRSAGPALGKIMQLVGILAIGVVIGRWGFYVVGLASLLFLSGAIYNFLQA